MKRIDTTSRAVDLFGAGKDGFKNGNLALGQAATQFNADWPNGVQEELLAIIEASGLAPSGGVLNQVLLALRSAGVFSTAPQFDSTTKAATTQFVQRALGNRASLQVYSGTQAITLSDVGKQLSFSGAAGSATWTLPAVSAVTPGSVVYVKHSNPGAFILTLQRAGADVIQTGSSSINSFAMLAGDTATLVSSGGAWLLVGGSASLPYASGAFGSSLATSGYQRLPSGAILQWGIANIGSRTTGVVTLPIAFPNAMRMVVASPYQNNALADGWAGYPISASQFGINNYNLTALDFGWTAVGN